MGQRSLLSKFLTPSVALGVERGTLVFVAAVLVAWNIVVFLLYGIDKRRSKRKSRRISEKALLLAALFFGATGALLGMQIFRHKTKHRRFTLGVPLLLLVNIAILIICIWYR